LRALGSLLARGGGRWAAIAVAAAGLLELAFHIHFAGAAPTLDEWSGLKSTVAGAVRPGTLIVVAPEWAEPNARLTLGSGLMPLEHVARPDESGFENVLEIAILGQSSPVLRGWSLESEREAGSFVLRHWLNPHLEPVRYDFLAHLEPATASVRVLGAAGSEDCPYGTGKVSNGDLGGHPTFPRRRFICKGADWSMVGLTVIEDQGYRPRRCIWAHPSSRGVLEVHFEGVPIGQSIRGYGGMPYLFEREWHGSPVDLEVLVGGESVGSYRHADGEGWKGFELSTAAWAGQTRSVDFRVRSRHVRDRQFCFQASVR
jgi:hypothetical protein